MAERTDRIAPSSPEASRRMRSVRQKGTSPEVLLRRELHSRGLRYRVQVALLSKPRRVADIVFRGPRIAVFVDGCFWHGCPEHATWPKKNAEFWRDKILTNRERDDDTNARLRAEGWEVIRVWSHEDAVDAADVQRDFEAPREAADSVGDGAGPVLAAREAERRVEGVVGFEWCQGCVNYKNIADNNKTIFSASSIDHLPPRLSISLPQ